MVKTRIRPGSIADKVIRIDEHADSSAWGVIVMGICGLLLAGMFGVGLNDIHPLY